MNEIEFRARFLPKEGRWMVLVDHPEHAFVVENRDLSLALGEAARQLGQGGYL